MHELTAFEHILVFVVGACVGSFLNVCIYRLPRHLSLVKPRSRCPKCEVPIRWWDNIPILSFILLRAKCRNCGERISLQYPLVEFLTAALFLLIYRSTGLTVLFVAYAVFSALLIVAFFIDLSHLIIPDRITIPGMVLGVTFAALTGRLRGSLLGIVVGAGILLCAAYLGKLVYKKEVMGYGDVKLAAMVGAFLGWQLLLLTMFLSFLSGAVIGLILIVLRKKTMASTVPFGPFISGSALFTLIYGERLLAWYLQLYG